MYERIRVDLLSPQKDTDVIGEKQQLFITLAELNGAPVKLIHATYATLFALRVIHFDFGLKKTNASGFGRGWGTLGTILVTVLTANYNLYLAWDSVKSLAGF
jgi:uncharacterized membrane protein YecN with MAPEG domain